MPIRGIIFDYGEVLCDAPPAGAWGQLAEAANVPEPALTAAYWSLRDEYARGAVTGEQYWQNVAKSVGAPAFSPDVVQRLIDLDCGQWSHLRQKMIDWACGLPPQGVKTAVLSTMHYDLLRVLERDCEWLTCFSHHTYSCRVGFVKPAREIYEHCLEGIGTAPDETVFLDDRVVNVEAARALGIRAHLFTSITDLPQELGAMRPRA